MGYLALGLLFLLTEPEQLSGTDRRRMRRGWPGPVRQVVLIAIAYLGGRFPARPALPRTTSARSSRTTSASCRKAALRRLHRVGHRLRHGQDSEPPSARRGDVRNLVCGARLPARGQLDEPRVCAANLTIRSVRKPARATQSESAEEQQGRRALGEIWEKIFSQSPRGNTRD
ncbi:DUF6256 family protein [Streptomyces cahuitamycinicus]|uniref:DUF6256 family protein n=1 Tax=Streptomyces cahuitamycinicus TaxID=2070367 RepID=UPI001CA59BBB